MQPDYAAILQTIHSEVQPLLSQGKVASYIPELSKVSARHFGMAVYGLDGSTYAIGDSQQKFSLQSVTKLFALALAFSREGDAIWERVGREPSGNPFNSLVQLEYERGKPRNPFINAGALVMTDILSARFVQSDIAVQQFARTIAGESTIDFDMAVAQSERQTAHRNYAIAHLMKDFGNLHNPVKTVIDSYCRQCSLTMTCAELAKAGSFLANHGTVPWSGLQILDASSSKRLNALMLTCGTYDAAGDFAYRVGLPAKSGVGGGILALVPGELAVAVWSPGLDATGNSLAGTYALERFTTLTARSIF
ncbi:glutaminase [Undibacterium sp. TS12]|uniref:glutaminase n=1 Tax=Undibacterium sp. TS12 TaxID=2908202 RepID=UPI001F4C63AE|nr:glutaminase [Undibacterium sp. TS12]MCH8618385.1 glutaminase [Undibacterium sp. TS12]